MSKGIGRAVAVGAAIALALPGSAAAAPPPAGAYQENDFSAGNAFNIVPPGQNGLTTAADLTRFQLDGTRPPHQADQNDMYANLVYATPGLQRGQILDFFKDASFGVEPANVERDYTPGCAITAPPSAGSEHCNDVRIVRDQFGIPHVYGQDRAALMFGLGYVTGEDRLFLADALRHAGRSDLSSFAGGGNAGQDRDTFSNAPYANEAELQVQYDQADDIYGQDGLQVQKDVQNYVDGMNQWIAEAGLDPVNKLDALYAATGNPEGPEPWDVTDVIATGALVAGIFGKGGGGEVGAATSLQAAKRVLGKRRGTKVWSDFRSADDPEAPATVRGKRFPYRVPEGRKGIAMPDAGSVEAVPIVPGGGGQATRTDAAGAQPLLEALEEVTAGSNALVISARESQTGHPLAVFGPQTSYFAPQLLMEQDAHAPASAEGPAIHARGVSFVGTNLYVQLGRGVDYAWSATSAGQDITDTFAVQLCEPGGGAASTASRGYQWNGQCLAMDVLEHTNSWVPTPADQTPPGSETMRVYRTNAGLLTHTATIKGKPYGYTKLRASYKREVDAAGSFADWNSPDKVHDAQSWIRSGYKNDLTFNWFYADSEEIAYFNSGANPVRAKGTHPNFPVLARPRFMWRDYDPALNTFRRAPLQSHPQVIDQSFLTSWNNKQARGYRCDGIRCYTSVYRVDSLDRNIKTRIGGAAKMSLTELIDAMETAGTVDLRGLSVVPFALKVLGKGGSPAVRSAAATMRRWVGSGSHRLDANDDGAYDQAEAVKIMDAWWPVWVEGQFKPFLGDELHSIFIGSGQAIHDAPRAQGSAFQGEVYGFAEKDLRTLLGKRVRGEYSRVYCGGGKLRACRAMLRRTLARAAATSFEAVYGTDGCTLNNGTAASPQMCGDAVNASDVTAAAVGEFHWINRPTFQQAISFPGGR